MEGTPYFPESAETPSIETPEKKKDDKKKKKGFEALLPEKRQAEAKKIAESLEKSPIFGEKKPETTEFEPKHLKEPEATAESAAPLETLGEEEKHEVVKELAADRKAEVQAELASAEPGSPEATEAAEVIADLERIEASGEIEGPTVMDEAEEAKEPVVEAIPFEDEGEISLADEAVEEPEDNTVAATVPPTVSGGGVPPPRGPAGGSSAGPGAPVGDRGFAAPVPGNLAPNPNMFSSAEVAQIEQQAGARGFIVGGILGYLLGRRRGRIRTEKRLMPVQQKLEKQVKGLQAELAARETSIRTFAFERLPEAQKTLARAERPASRLGLEKPTRIERLGKAVVGVEAPTALKPELRNIAPEHVKDMGRTELLLLSEKVMVEGASLRQIYEQHLIGERGLRHLITEYLQGKDIRKDLHKEMVEREIDFERDPILRDSAYHASGGVTSTSSLKQLLEKVGASDVADDPLISVAKLQAAAKEEVAVRKKHRRQLVDTAMVTVIVVLATVVTFLLLER